MTDDTHPAPVDTPLNVAFLAWAKALGRGGEKYQSAKERDHNGVATERDREIIALYGDEVK